MKNYIEGKYILLVVLLLLGLKVNLHFGDYCEGMAKGLLFLFLLGLIFLTLIFILIKNLYNMYKKKEKFDFIPLVLVVVFFFLNYGLMIANENHFWKKIRYKGTNDDIKQISIILFEDNSFEITNFYIENRCIFKGKYHFEKKVLILEDDKIDVKTDENFTNEYILTSNNILVPLNRKFRNIELIK